jgi:hypothetical protein
MLWKLGIVTIALMYLLALGLGIKDKIRKK